ncbi:MAG: hypothetical protein NC344_01930 [Bacteroidales bacterium]|nr:hypothetical protein [Bacteroidales bacterium]MCM1146592.1 hypothetical protein [Bacteroidales bacterium]MCM1205984.1 hypothetical protein [Bacillota bacterium]MCM1510135.1 hypothetical protein [Clostridium sp.]
MKKRSSRGAWLNAARQCLSSRDRRFLRRRKSGGSQARDFAAPPHARNISAAAQPGRYSGIG